MKDIDFDELDRAVSSVLGQQGPKEDDSVSTAQTVVTEESVEATATPEAETFVETTPPVQEQPATSATPLAVKRRGKFMDVMHPSADMTSATPAAPVKPRTNPVLQPLSDNVTPETPAPEAAEMSVSSSVVEPTAELDESHALIGAEPAPVENLLPEHVGEDAVETTQSTQTASIEDTPSEPVAAESVQDESAEPVKSLYVDPLDLAKPDEQPTEEAGDSDAEQSAETSEEQSGTPFLPDAQVDKRPLGAFGEAENTSTEASTPAPEQAAQPTDNTQASPAVPLPRELQPDVVEVESAAAQDVEVSPVPLASEAEGDETNDGRVEGHPLFDTSTYHEPIAAAHGKGMPGWVKWLIGLLVCLALGAGVGYFLFTAGL